MTITASAPRAAAYRGRLRWWTELPLIAVVYALYSAARLLVRGDVDDAVEHGADILHFEQLMHLDPEGWFNRLFTDHAFLGVPADFAYASLHYIVTPVVLVWLWRRRPTHYRVARTWLMISTLIGLVGFTALPTAPPRLLTGHHGFIDTMAQYGSYGWWGSDASAPRGMGHLTNEYAAMPSLHVGWAMWCGIMLWRYGRHGVVRTLGVIYPVVTALVVMGTANHYLMDAAAGAFVMGLGYLLTKPALRRTDALQARFGGKASTASAASPATTPAMTPAMTPASAIVASSAAAPSGTPPISAPPRPRTTAGSTDRTVNADRTVNGGPGRAELTLPIPRAAPAPPSPANTGPNSGAGPDTGSGVGPEATVPDGEPAARS